jgi:hypothetical protein
MINKSKKGKLYYGVKMTAPNVLNQKWLSDVELLDFEIEQSDSLKPANVEKFFTSIASTQTRDSLTSGITRNYSLVSFSNAPTLPLVDFTTIFNG